MILEVGKVIYSLLANDEKVTNLVHKKIYPLIADSDTTFPFIIYKRNSISILTSKDRLINKEEATIEIAIASDKYNESVNVATAVIKALHNKKGDISNINVKKIELLQADEDYIDDTFIQKLFFKIEI